MGSLISDLRDYKGDKIVGIKTLPVYLGYRWTKKIIYSLLFGISVFILQLNLFYLLPLLLFIPLILLFILKNKPEMAHFYGNISLIFLTAWLMIV